MDKKINKENNKTAKTLAVKGSGDNLKVYEAKNEYNQQIIDEYFVNGLSKIKAIQAIRPDLKYNSAMAIVSSIFKDRQNQEYIKHKQDIVKSEAGIEALQVLRELTVLAFSDVTDYIGLTLAQLKELPPEVRRCIQAYDYKKTSYLPRGAEPGEEVTEETIKLKLKDSMKAFDMINKYIGFYDKDNKQKANTINLNNVSVDNLNVLLQVANQVKAGQ